MSDLGVGVPQPHPRDQSSRQMPTLGPCSLRERPALVELSWDEEHCVSSLKAGLSAKLNRYQKVSAKHRIGIRVLPRSCRGEVGSHLPHGLTRLWAGPSQGCVSGPPQHFSKVHVVAACFPSIRP